MNSVSWKESNYIVLGNYFTSKQPLVVAAALLHIEIMYVIGYSMYSEGQF